MPPNRRYDRTGPPVTQLQSEAKQPAGGLQPARPTLGDKMYPVPPNEAARLRILDETGMMYSEPSDKFDRLCWLAAELFDAPMAAVTLNGKDVQCLNARIGLDLVMTAREAAFCNHTVLHDEVLVVSDAPRDHRLSRLPNWSLGVRKIP